MKILVMVFLLFLCGCAVGAATSGYSIKSGTSDELSAPARKSIVDEIKSWVSENFQEKK